MRNELTGQSHPGASFGGPINARCGRCLFVLELHVCHSRGSSAVQGFSSHQLRLKVSSLRLTFCQRVRTPELLTSLALGKVSSRPLAAEEIENLKGEVVELLESHGFCLDRDPGDRKDIPIDYRFLSLLLRASHDSKVSLGSFSH